ncbi:hypothetical protein BH20ACT1_BH20ACT1_04310 [soil metagenome]
MAATGSDSARSGATRVDRGVAGPSLPPGDGHRPPTPEPGGQDWAAQTADAVERGVAAIRSKTAEPLERAARALVYGLVAAIVGIAAGVLGAVAMVRLLDIALPGEVWSAHALAGGIFTLVGLFLWKKRTVKTIKV